MNYFPTKKGGVFFAEEGRSRVNNKFQNLSDKSSGSNMTREEKGMKFCVNCGGEIDYKAEICPKCGVRQPVIASPEGAVNLYTRGLR
jgi:predicted RNA-binding Zn-ribbon protein involved in translation (DUF1610 family)